MAGFGQKTSLIGLENLDAYRWLDRKCGADGAILPVAIVDVHTHETPEELRAIGEFMLTAVAVAAAAAEFDLAHASNSILPVGSERE